MKEAIFPDKVQSAVFYGVRFKNLQTSVKEEAKIYILESPIIIIITIRQTTTPVTWSPTGELLGTRSTRVTKFIPKHSPEHSDHEQIRKVRIPSWFCWKLNPESPNIAPTVLPWAP